MTRPALARMWWAWAWVRIWWAWALGSGAAHWMAWALSAGAVLGLLAAHR